MKTFPSKENITEWLTIKGQKVSSEIPEKGHKKVIYLSSGPSGAGSPPESTQKIPKDSSEKEKVQAVKLNELSVSASRVWAGCPGAEGSDTE